MSIEPASSRKFRELYAARHEPENLRPLAGIVWRTLLILSILGIIAEMILAISVFSMVLSNVSSIPSSSIPPAALDRKKLDQIVLEISGRASIGSGAPLMGTTTSISH